MDAWRISNYADLSGFGGTRTSGRWHTIGRPIVYLADHQGGALLEILVHMDRNLIPATYRLLRVQIPDAIPMEITNISDLPHNWRDNPNKTREIGDKWLDSSSAAILKVPSAILPRAQNYLLNPRHANATTVRIVEIIDAPFDPRLFPDA
jgi:RES domain-containing protein